MTNIIYHNDLLNLIKEYNNKIPRSNNIKNKYPEIYQLLLTETNFLPEKSLIPQRFWHIKNNTKDIPLCKHCNDNHVNWHSSRGGYVSYCSLRCASRSKLTLQKCKETCLKKFGETSYSKTDKFKKMITSEEHLKNLNSEEIKNKRKETCLKKYGVEHSSKSLDVKQKRIDTNIKRYGVANAGGTEESIRKIKQTIKERYGVDHYNETNEFKNIMKEYHNDSERMQLSLDKQKETLQRKYGVNCTFEMESVQEKIKKSFKSKYGCHPTQAHISKEILDLLNNREWLLEQHHDLERTASSISEELEVHVCTVLDYLRKNSIEVRKFSSSEAEHEICEFLDSINIEYIRNTTDIINPYELDVYIPEYNVAIEYNGLFWHSEVAGKNENYHLNKTEMCETKGIRLIHIFEDEWRDQNQKCKDTLKHIFGKSEKGVYARNTIIKEIPWKQAKEFLNNYHLLNAGTCGNYRIGAFDKDDNLIGVMVFGHKNNEGNDTTIELKRFVTNKKNNPGLGSKMFKYAIVQKNYQEIIAFVDRRWFTGLVKDHIGFTYISTTKPALWWTNGEERYYRRFKTKQGLIKDGFDSSMSKRKMLESLGYYRIWDCGKIKLKWMNL